MYTTSGALDVLEVLLPADAVLPALAAQLAEGGPHAARLAAEAAAAAAAQAVASAAAAAAAAAASSRSDTPPIPPFSTVSSPLS